MAECYIIETMKAKILLKYENKWVALDKEREYYTQR